MPVQRVRTILIGLLGLAGTTLLLPAAGALFDLPALITAVRLTDTLLGVLGLLMAAMVGIAGSLVVTDLRADVAAARAWQTIAAELAVVGAPDETVPDDQIVSLYAVTPQDEGLRRILLAHRFAVPAATTVRSQADLHASAQAAAIPVGERGTDGTVTGLLSTGDCSTADGLAGARTTAFVTEIDRTSRSIQGNAKCRDERGQRSDTRCIPKARLVANAGFPWDWKVATAAGLQSAPADGLLGEVIVLSGRKTRDGDLARGDTAPAPAATGQTSCRGPPTRARHWQAASALGLAGDPFREKGPHRATAPVDPIVIDNLGDHAPVGAAELQVVETYLDDVLRDVLGSVDTATKPT